MARETKEYREELNAGIEKAKQTAEDKIGEELETAKKTIQLKADQRSLRLLEEKTKQEQRLKEKYDKAQKMVSDEHNQKLSMLPRPVLPEREKKVMEERYADTAKIGRLRADEELHMFSLELAADVKKARTESEASINRISKEYETDEGQRVDRLIASNRAKSTALDFQGVTEEIQRIRREAEREDTKIDAMSSDLENVRAESDRAKTEFSALEAEAAEERKRGMKQAGDPESRDDEELRRTLAEKDAIIKSLQEELALANAFERKQENKTAIPGTEETDKIESLVIDIRSLKSTIAGIAMQQSICGGKHEHTAGHTDKGKLFQQRKPVVPCKPNRSVVVTTAKENAAEPNFPIDSKMTEISLFLQNEEAEVLASRKKAVVDYEVSKKLLQTLETSKKELRREMVFRGKPALSGQFPNKLESKAQRLAAKLSYLRFVLAADWI